MKSHACLCFALTLIAQPAATRAEAQTIKWKYPSKSLPWVRIASYEEVTMPAAETYLSPGGVKVKVPMPRALTTPDELEKLNPGLMLALPGLPAMMTGAVAAPEFERLYQAKKKRVMRGKPLDEYNYFDCASVLRLKHPKTQRAILLVQSDMDVDTDGSDPVRYKSVDDYADSLVSHSFLPMLSYRWDQPPGTSHPLPKYFQSAVEQLTKYQAEVRAGLEKNSYPLWQRNIMRGVEEACEEESANIRQNFIRTESGNIPGNVRDMRTSSSLLGPYDPFIVIPSNWFGSLGKVKIGDYAVVIVNKKIYPAIVADAGPTAQCGEASLKICREIEPQASGVYRAVDGPKATYVVFTGTGTEERGPLRTEALQKAVGDLLGEIGGVGMPGMMHVW